MSSQLDVLIQRSRTDTSLELVNKISEALYEKCKASVGPMLNRFPNHREEILVASMYGCYMCVRDVVHANPKEIRDLVSFVCRSAIYSAYSYLRECKTVRRDSGIGKAIDISFIEVSAVPVNPVDLDDLQEHYAFSPVERKIIEQLGDGYKQLEIADNLDISEGYVSKKIKNIQGKIERKDAREGIQA